MRGGGAGPGADLQTPVLQSVLQLGASAASTAEQQTATPMPQTAGPEQSRAWWPTPATQLHRVVPHRVLTRAEDQRRLVLLICTQMWLWGCQEKENLGVPKPGCFKPGCLQFLCFCALLRSFAPFCGLALALFCGLAFALFCAHLRVSVSNSV